MTRSTASTAAPAASLRDLVAFRTRYTCPDRARVARPAVPAMRSRYAASCTRASCSWVAERRRHDLAALPPPFGRRSRPSRRRARGTPGARAASDARQIVRTRSGSSAITECPAGHVRALRAPGAGLPARPAPSMPPRPHPAALRAVLPWRAPRARTAWESGCDPSSGAPVAIRLDVKRQHGVARGLCQPHGARLGDPRRTAGAVDRKCRRTAGRHLARQLQQSSAGAAGSRSSRGPVPEALDDARNPFAVEVLARDDHDRAVPEEVGGREDAAVPEGKDRRPTGSRDRLEMLEAVGVPAKRRGQRCDQPVAHDRDGGRLRAV